VDPSVTSANGPCASPPHAGIVELGGTPRRVRCILCHDEASSIGRGSLPGHLVSSFHLENTQKRDAAVLAQQLREEQIAAAYGISHTPHHIPPGYNDSLQSWRPNLTEFPQSLTAHERDLFPGPSPDQISIELPPTFDPTVEQAKLQDQALHLLRLAEERDEFGNDFFNDRDESREVLESLERMGMHQSHVYLCHFTNGTCRTGGSNRGRDSFYQIQSSNSL
jgi:hypothetical protein